MKFYLILFAVSVLLSSCLKQSIADAMLDTAKGETVTLSYEINGTAVKLSVRDADNQGGGYYNYYKLACHKSNGYNFYGITDHGEFTFSFYTDSLKVGNYKYTATREYVTDFGFPCYMAGPTDNMNINVTSYTKGRISGNFTGQISPAPMQGPYGPVFGAYGSVVIKNGLFSNVPVIY